MAGPHDRMFRRSFDTPEALRWLIGAALPSLHLHEPPTLLPTATLAKGVERIPDLLCDLPDWPLRVAVQHQRRPERDIALRVAHDAAVLAAAMHRARTHRHLLTLVVYQGPGPWRPATRVPPLAVAIPHDVAQHCPNHAYPLLHLGHLSDDTLQHAPPAVALATRFLRDMAVALDREPAEDPWNLYLRHSHALAALRHTGGLEAIEQFLRYIYDITKQPPGAHIMAQLTEHHPDLAAETLTFTEQLEAAARQEGREEGRELTLREILERVLPERLGPPPDEVCRWLEQASPSQLEAAAHQIFRFRSWKEVTRL